MSQKLDTRRIDHLLNPETAEAVTVTVAGLGSGGTPVLRYLAMCGIRRWHLFDPDVLESVNLVKHPARRAELGRPKVEIARDWLLDRNPASTVAVAQRDVIKDPGFEKAVAESDLVICAVDSNGAREYVNDVAVRAQVPVATGLVFRQGFGGEVYLYVPGRTGCYRCMQAYCESEGLSLNTDDEMSPEEEEEIYGLDNRLFQLSGLPVDIGLIATLHAQVALSFLLGGSTLLPRPAFNWLVFANRPFRDVFRATFESKKLMLRPQHNCPIACHRDAQRTAANLSSYGALELPPGASRRRIKRSYQRLAKLYHPDRAKANGDEAPESAAAAAATAKFRAVQEAYDSLTAGEGPRR